MSGLPVSLSTPLREALQSLGDATDIRSAQLLGGGCINHAMRLATEKRSYLLKWNADALPGMFPYEARGLELLAATKTVRVPLVLAVQEASAGSPAWILLEWLEGSRNGDMAPLGEQLANLHRLGTSPQTPPAYGLDHNNYIGSSPQLNGWEEDWAAFFARFRLRPQMELAQKNGYLPTQRRQRLERFIERLPALLGGFSTRPSLIHGDLWGGNVIPGPDGLALIDPAVSYSDREAEMAFTEMFGGFSPRFYAAYQQTWPLDPGYRDRLDIYNLYHLLNHLNLFGEGYGGQVDAVLRHYTTVS